ncbi:MAG: hypothetical protein Q4F21_12195 [Lachnospiraceae bacterium]|nr:hypothetical protein [Lachnospiraceae bacterium]
MRKMIKYIVLVAVIILLNGAIYLMDSRMDSKPPVLTADKDTISISVKDAEKKLLEGMSAKDDKDGDLTDQIMVEEISPFHIDKTRTVSYVVMDSSMNVARIKRRVSYTDYHSPEFSLKEDPAHNSFTEVDITKTIRAEDVVDGDISDKIRLVASDMDAFGATAYTYEVTNSCGDFSDITIYDSKDIINRADLVRVPKIVLKDYLIYTDRGQKPDFKSYIKELKAPEKSGETENELTVSDIKIEIKGNPKKDDCYYVDYTIITEDNLMDTARLTVAVTDQAKEEAEK